MKIRYILLFSPAGFMLQVLLFIFCPYVEKPTSLLLLSPYDLWIYLGEILERNSGGGGHAFAGGVILGILAGVLLYSLLIGTVLGCIYDKLIRPRLPFNELK